jgi:hypothetical protein
VEPAVPLSKSESHMRVPYDAATWWLSIAARIAETWYLHDSRFAVAFPKGDTAEMDRQSSWATGSFRASRERPSPIPPTVRFAPLRWLRLNLPQVSNTS